MDDQQQNSQEPIVDEYKGNKILILNPGSRFPFSFGLGKAKMIMQNLDAIRKFIEQYEKKPE
ncbi:MAG TPA: hypothetical protein VLY03_08675 [Bacteroidota bacterium]|nr:hypothetical protein [Bacteroidota bacterium]